MVCGEKIISKTRSVEMFCSVPGNYNKRTSGYKKTGNVMGLERIMLLEWGGIIRVKRGAAG